MELEKEHSQAHKNEKKTGVSPLDDISKNVTLPSSLTKTFHYIESYHKFIGDLTVCIEVPEQDQIQTDIRNVWLVNIIYRGMRIGKQRDFTGTG